MVNITRNIKKWMKFTCLFLLSIFSITAKSESFISNSNFGTSRGVVWTGTKSTGNWTTTLSNAGSKTWDLSQYWTGGLSANYSGSYWGEVDGRKGLVLAPGILLEFSGSSVFSMTGGGRYPADPINAIYNWGEDPQVTNNSKYKIQYNTGRWATLVTSTYTDWWNNGSFDSGLNLLKQNNFTPRLYLSSDLPAGKYDFSGYVEIVDNEKPGSWYTRILSNISFSTETLECTISSPPTIDFGNVNLTGQEKDGDILSYSNGNLNVSCSGSATGATATISVSGDKGRYTDTLQLTGTSDSAEIRGVIGNPVTPTGSCSAKADGYNNFITFSNGTPVNIGKITSGNNQIPYSFTLCSKGIYSLGKANATATISLDWD